MYAAGEGVEAGVVVLGLRGEEEAGGEDGFGVVGHGAVCEVEAAEVEGGGVSDGGGVVEGVLGPGEELPGVVRDEEEFLVRGEGVDWLLGVAGLGV